MMKKIIQKRMIRIMIIMMKKIPLMIIMMKITATRMKRITVILIIVKEIPWYQKKRTIQYLNRIEYISMRENRGSEIVKELTGRDVPTILDPVFFLSKNEWHRYRCSRDPGSQDLWQ